MPPPAAFLAADLERLFPVAPDARLRGIVTEVELGAVRLHDGRCRRVCGRRRQRAVRCRGVSVGATARAEVLCAVSLTQVTAGISC